MCPARSVWLLTVGILTAGPLRVLAQAPENVAVVINDLSADSQRIGEYYARTRGLPPSNVLRIQAATDEAIERDAYVRTIERPLGRAIVAAGLHDRLLYLVLTKGIPLRINGTSGVDGTEASVDSELTLLYRQLLGQAVTAGGPVDNPYFLGTRNVADARAFSHEHHDIYLVTRLDAFTASEAISLVDRSQSPVMEGRIVLDQRTAGAASATGDEWLRRAAERLIAQGHEQRLMLEETSKPAQLSEGVLGLSTWGAADPEHRARTTGLKFVPGAIAANLTSFDARTFRAPPQGWQPTGSSDRTQWFEGTGDALIGDLIREGITGASGQVAEAYLRGAVRPEILFPAYVAGFNLAEAFYLAVPVLSWKTVIVGDPLTAPFPGRRLSKTELDPPIDKETLLPQFFSRRQIETIVAVNPAVPRAAIAPYLRALTLVDKGDNDDALRALTEAAAGAPRNADWLTSVALLQERAKDYPAAAATYQDVLKLHATHLVAMNNLAYLLAVRVGKPAEALPLAQRAAALAPQSASIIDTLGWTEHLLGNNENASKRLEEAIRLNPQQGEIRLHAAVVYAALGLREQSDEQLKEALRLDPTLEGRPEVLKLRQPQ